MAFLMRSQRSKHLQTAFTLCFLALCYTWNSWGAEPRIKDITQIRGVQPIRLVGVGLVTGLNGTGGAQDATTATFLANMFQRFGNTIPLQAIRAKNAAVVMVHATLPPYAKQGSRLEVTVTSPGTATSLQGGFLEPTPLVDALNPKGSIHAVAGGAISLGGFSVSSQGASVQKNQATAGRIPNGATVEKEPLIELTEDGVLTLVLYHADFTTATNIVSKINEFRGNPISQASDAGTIQIQVPEESKSNLVSFIAELGNLRVKVDNPAAVIVDEQTGTIVIGENVQISPVAVTHGNLRVEVSTESRVSQPLPFTAGETITEQNTDIKVTEEDDVLRVIPDSTTIHEVVDALNALGATPQDLISILLNIAEQGALHAQLIIR